MEHHRIIRNSAECLVCGDEIESKYRHDYVSCTCKSLSVNGGHCYLGRSFPDHSAYRETSIIEEGGHIYGD